MATTPVLPGDFQLDDSVVLRGTIVGFSTNGRVSTYTIIVVDPRGDKLQIDNIPGQYIARGTL